MPRTMALLIALGVLSACAAPDPDSARFGGTFLAENGLRVVPQADRDVVEVLANPGTAGRGFFCAAADYGFRRLNVPPATAIVLIQPVGPSVANPGGRSVFFRFDPTQPVPVFDGISVSARDTGEKLSVAHGRALCRGDRIGFFNDDFP